MNSYLLAGGSNTTPDITNAIFRGSLLETLQQGMTIDPGSVINEFLPRIIGLLLIFGVVAFFFILLWGAVSWIISGGDKAHIESAKGRITSALIGLVLMLSTFAIIKLIETFFGIDILSIDIGPLVIQ